MRHERDFELAAEMIRGESYDIDNALRAIDNTREEIIEALERGGMEGVLWEIADGVCRDHDWFIQTCREDPRTEISKAMRIASNIRFDGEPRIDGGRLLIAIGRESADAMRKFFGMDDASAAVFLSYDPEAKEIDGCAAESKLFPLDGFSAKAKRKMLARADAHCWAATAADDGLDEFWAGRNPNRLPPPDLPRSPEKEGKPCG